MEAINKMPIPSNITELKAFVGMVNYFGRFIQNVSTILYSLIKLLHKNSKFVWSRECQQSFNKAKRKFQSEEILLHFDPQLPLVLATDASSNCGVGAVLSNVKEMVGFTNLVRNT